FDALVFVCPVDASKTVGGLTKTHRSDLLVAYEDERPVFGPRNGYGNQWQTCVEREGNESFRLQHAMNETGCYEAVKAGVLHLFAVRNHVADSASSHWCLNSPFAAGSIKDRYANRCARHEVCALVRGQVA